MHFLFTKPCSGHNSLKGADFLNIKRYVNGKPVSQTEFKTMEIRNKAAEKIIEKANFRINTFDEKQI